MQWQLSECWDSPVGIAAWNRPVVIQGSIVSYECVTGNLRIISIIEVSWSVWPLYLHVPRISFTLQARWLGNSWGSVLSSYGVQGNRHKVQRPDEIRGRFSAWSFPFTGGRTCAVPWRKLLWEGVSLAMHIPCLKVQPGSLSWFKVTGKRRGSTLAGWAWVARSPTGRQKGHREGEGGRRWCWVWRDVSYIIHQSPSGQLWDSRSALLHSKITVASALRSLPADLTTPTDRFTRWYQTWVAMSDRPS